MLIFYSVNYVDNILQMLFENQRKNVILQIID